MIKSLDEAISYYKKKYELLKNYDNLKAEEYKQLADWLIDYKELKECIFNTNNRWEMIKKYSKEEITDEEIEALKEGLCQ